jgi:hypothetical protein
MSKTAPELTKKAARRAINRLLVRCRDEIIALSAAAQVISGAEYRLRLQQQARRRAVWCQDLGEGVALLGGVPAKRASRTAELASWLRYLKRVLTGPHAGDAYKACARACEKTARACRAALDVGAPRYVQLVLADWYAEIEIDRKELRRLRWGAMPAPAAPDDQEITGAARTRADAAPDHALEAFRGDGGPEKTGIRRGERGDREEPTISAPKVTLATD